MNSSPELAAILATVGEGLERGQDFRFRLCRGKAEKGR